MARLENIRERHHWELLVPFTRWTGSIVQGEGTVAVFSTRWCSRNTPFADPKKNYTYLIKKVVAPVSLPFDIATTLFDFVVSSNGEEPEQASRFSLLRHAVLDAWEVVLLKDVYIQDVWSAWRQEMLPEPRGLIEVRCQPKVTRPFGPADHIKLVGFSTRDVG